MKPFTIVDEQQDFIIINKAANVSFHDEGNELGLHSLVKQHVKLGHLYPVHRLDKITSGLLIFAKNKLTAQTFQQLFERKEVIKFYLAISDKKPKKKQGLIAGDMEKSRRGMWKLTRSMHNPAKSQFFSYSLTPQSRLFLIKPLTGKTHQIRVALSSIGSPILGDTYYAKSTADRGYLHAFGLSFTLNEQQYRYQVAPDSGEHFLTDDCLSAIDAISDPWQLPWPKKY
ncbi:TIGR01621 family pseudouridine synthase [Thalassotalea sp. PP2-459]|uniref:TIGR01621 family pseudouridine synthase n=1 Tax=Thalassotalea sp. PP2-459 TaxID=1742724 RepID=UPI000942F76E|nr:TIGR01621 family pseudouridine synthase [Thalassotalea sp. PP2-459]OKY24906.1 RNA pseudouridine synthase [Thalassotalea sp. PP2-459]